MVSVICSDFELDFSIPRVTLALEKMAPASMVVSALKAREPPTVIAYCFY